MTERMYAERVKNIPAFRGCRFGCVYCVDSFQRLVKLNKKCSQCATFEPHFHPEALDKTPPKTKAGEFLTIGLSGDVSFASHDDLVRISSYCAGWSDRTFLIQSKNPAVFLEHYWPENVILGTTIESNCWWWDYSKPKINIMYDQISKAPSPAKRYDSFVKLACRKAVTIEPVLDFTDDFLKILLNLNPEFIYVGYNSNPKIHLPEPSLAKTQELVARLRESGVIVKEKLMRKAWWEA